MTSSNKRLNSVAKIIGLAGAAGSGKDTVCQIIQELLAESNLVVERDAFADRLKVSAARSLGNSGDKEECIADMNWIKLHGYIGIFDDEGNLKGGISGREYLQYFGTEGHRQVFSDSFWVDQVLPDYQAPFHGRQPFDILVITDVRFPDETARLRECGAEIWKVRRSSAILPGTQHSSEQGVPDEDCDFFIDNEGSMEALKSEVSRVLGVTYETESESGSVAEAV